MPWLLGEGGGEVAVELHPGDQQGHRLNQPFRKLGLVTQAVSKVLNETKAGSAPKRRAREKSLYLRERGAVHEERPGPWTSCCPTPEGGKL